MQLSIVRPLLDLKTQAQGQCDAAAGACRLKYISDFPGQALTYQAKAAEAANFVEAAYNNNPNSFPWIRAEALATGQTGAQVVAAINAQSATWAQKGPAIEAARQFARQQIAAATTAAQIRAALDALAATLAAL